MLMLLLGSYISSVNAGYKDVLTIIGSAVGSAIAPGIGTTVGGMIGSATGDMLSGGERIPSSYPTANHITVAPVGNFPTYRNDDSASLREALQTWRAQHQDAAAAHKQLVDDILHTNERQMAQLLKADSQQLQMLVSSNTQQRRDLLAALDKEGARFERIISGIHAYAASGRSLDHATIMELLTGSRAEREGMYGRHKQELDQLVKAYNAKLQAAQQESAAQVAAAQQERHAALAKLQDMLQSLNRQLVMSQVAYINCSRNIDRYTWCGIRYQQDLAKCADLKKQVELCDTAGR